MTFEAPAEESISFRLRDARGLGGDDFQYQLIARPPHPGYQLTVSGTELSIPRGGGREWSVSVKRFDGMTAAIHISLSGLPNGVLATNPLIVEVGQFAAMGTIYVRRTLS